MNRFVEVAPNDDYYDESSSDYEVEYGEHKENEETIATKFCRYCGTKIPEDSIYCEQCGSRL